MLHFFRAMIRLPIAVFSLFIITQNLFIATILEIGCALVYFIFCAIFLSEDYLVQKSWLRYFPVSITKTKTIFSLVFRWGFDKEKSILSTIKEEGNFNDVFITFNSISFVLITVYFLTYMESWLLFFGAIVLFLFVVMPIFKFFEKYIDWVNFKEYSSNKENTKEE